ncbi:hypothetical protein BHE74_00039898 [Ensete ventricosum]|nr:hypothetical protein BHE74_00039898 [Ensete ventricosum]
MVDMNRSVKMKWEFMESTVTLLLPKTTSAGKSRSKVLAPTVRIHGATFVTVELSGPELPAGQTTVIPFFTAWNAPMSSEFSKYSEGRPPREKEKDVDAIVDRCVEGGQDVGVEALASEGPRPADLVGGDASARRAAHGGAVGVAEDAGPGHEVAGGGESVAAVPVVVSRGVKGGIERASGGSVRLVEVPSTDQLPAS